MLEIVLDFDFYGFAFGPTLDKINFDEIYENLFLRHILMEDVIFSTFFDEIYDVIWIIAGSRYVTEKEIIDIIDFIIDNSLEDRYILIENIYE